MDEEGGGDHLGNQNPSFISDSFHLGVGFLQTYGWFVVMAVVALFCIKSKFEPRINRYMKKQEEQREYSQYDADKAARRQQSMDDARRRLQEKLDAQAALFSEKQKQIEEQKRKEKLEDWDRHQQGRGYKSKYKAHEESEPRKPLKKPSSSKKPLRNNDYNPLMGDSGGGSSLRSPHRGGATGGG